MNTNRYLFRMAVRTVQSLAVVFMIFGCSFEIPELDIESPRAIHYSPIGVSNTTPTISIVFSKIVDHEKLEVANAFVLVKTEEVTSAFLSDLNNPPLLASRQDLVVGGGLSLLDSADQTTLTFVPSRPLEGETAYSFFVSRSVTDINDNPLVVPLVDENGEEVLYPESHPIRPNEPVLVAGNFRADFFTGRAVEVEGPQVMERFPENGAVNVPPNISSVSVLFNQPAHNVNNLSFQVRNPHDQAVSSSSVDLTDGRTRAELFLAEELEVDTEYRIVLSSQIRDEQGNSLDEEMNWSSFTTASCIDEASPIIAPESVDALPVDRYALIRWRANEPSTSRVRFGREVPELEVEGPPGRCTLTNYDPCDDEPIDADCRHEVRIEGLVPETEYVFEVESRDAAGNATIRGVYSFETLEPLPPLVLNEVQATPEAAPQETAEFIEVYNAGQEPVNLEGWEIVDASASPVRAQRLQAFGTAQTVLESGEYALIVGQAFNVSFYPALSTDVILSGSGSRILTYGLADDRGLMLELRSPEGAVVSTFGGWYRGRDNRNVSIERIDSTGPDSLDNWTWSTEASGSTPGYTNSVVE